MNLIQTVRFFVIKANKMHYFSTLFGKELYMFRIDILSIIRSFNTVFTAKGICHASYVGCLLARLGCNILTSLPDSREIVYVVELLNYYTNHYTYIKFIKFYTLKH